MLNYVWMGLIVIGIVVAVGNDVSDEISNPYRNGVPLVSRFEVDKAPGSLHGLTRCEPFQTLGLPQGPS